MGAVCSFWGGKPTQALSDLMMMVNANVRAIDELTQRPLTNITVNMLKRTGKAPRLRANAGESRHMVPVVLYILKNWVPPQNDYERTRFACLQALNILFITSSTIDGLVFGAKSGEVGSHPQYIVPGASKLPPGGQNSPAHWVGDVSLRAEASFVDPPCRGPAGCLWAPKRMLVLHG